jgi:hypothetical protein
MWMADQHARYIELQNKQNAAAQKAGGISMKKFAGCGLSLVMAILIGFADFAAAQNAGMRMAMAKTTLLLAQLDATQVVGGSSSSATGTGAFLLDPSQHTLAYSLTYQGLEAGGSKSIALYNFGKGKNGDSPRVFYVRATAKPESL